MGGLLGSQFRCKRSHVGRQPWTVKQVRSVSAQPRLVHTAHACSRGAALPAPAHTTTDPHLPTRTC